MYRQGDVLIIKVDKLPKNLTAKDVTLAYGEVTGHKHQLVGQVQVFKDSTDNQFFKVMEVSKLVHEEHAEIELEPGFYKVIQQREFDLAEGNRIVMD